MPRARTLVTSTLAAAVAVTGPLVLSAPSGAASAGSVTATDDTPGYSVTAITVDVTTGPAGDQPCRVSADLYRPDGATSSRKAPAILTTHGFGGDKADDNQLAIAQGFVKRGYVVLSYSGLGFGTTTCKISLDDPAFDGRAGKQMVDVLAGTRAYTPEGGGAATKIRYVAQEKTGDPRVGMIGGSYGGQIQYAVASQDPRVDALIPIITWNDLSYSLAPNNTSTTSGVTYETPGVAKKQWVNLFSAAGILSGAQNVVVAGDPDTLGGCPNFVTAVCPAFVQLNTLGYPDAGTLDLARSASVSTYVKKVKAPTLLVQGQADTLFNLQEAVATYRSLEAQGTPTRMVWQSWGHSNSEPAPGELDFGAASLTDSFLGKRFVNWMDHYVRGNAKASVGPEFSYFRDWVDYDTSPANAGKAIAKAYAAETSFSQRKTASLYLSGTDALIANPANVAKGAASYANVGPVPTSYSETSGLEGSVVNNEPSDAPGTVASWTSKPLTEPADLVGSPQLTVRLDAPVAEAGQGAGPAGQLVLFAKLYDVAPDGTLTLKNRLVSPVRVTDVTKPVKITLPGVVQRFDTGHRLRLVLAASDAAYAGNVLPQPVTVLTGRNDPGVLALPLRSALEF